MTSTWTYIRGHECYWDYTEKIWKYADNDSEVDDTRACPQCNRFPTEEGYDPCIGKIEGATSVCCGHGVEDGYIIWKKEN